MASSSVIRQLAIFHRHMQSHRCPMWAYHSQGVCVGRVSDSDCSGMAEDSGLARVAKNRRAEPTDPVSPATSLRMSKTQSDNPNEKRFRSALHQLGYRFRVHYRAMPGSRRTVDIAFPRARLAVFIDGCFWHGCPIHRSRLANNNGRWWREKIEGNKLRDRDTDNCLGQLGWKVLRVWEHEDHAEALTRIVEALRVSQIGN